MATLTPSWPSRMAIAWPMPELPPVTMATLSCSPFMTSSWCGAVGRLGVGRLPGGAGPLPGGADLGDGGVEVGLGAAEQVLQVGPELLGGGPAPEPVADVHLVDDQPWGQHQGVGDGGVVVGVGVLGDAEGALDL